MANALLSQLPSSGINFYNQNVHVFWFSLVVEHLLLIHPNRLLSIKTNGRQA